MTTKRLKNNQTTAATHAYVHRLADVHFAGFAPAFTLSLCDSECSRNPPVPIVCREAEHRQITVLHAVNKMVETFVS